SRAKEAIGKISRQQLPHQVGTAQRSLGEVPGLERQLAVAKHSGGAQGAIPPSGRQPSCGTLHQAGQPPPSEPGRDALVLFGKPYALVRRVPREQLVAAIAAEDDGDMLARELGYVISRQRRRIAKRLVEVAHQSKERLR